jgi:hypothetical protein
MIDSYQDDYGVFSDPRYFAVTPEEYRKITNDGTDVDLSGYYTSGQTDELLALKQDNVNVTVEEVLDVLNDPDK